MAYIDTTIGVAANSSSSGQSVDFDGAGISNLTITNGSGISVQYSVDAGSTWTTVANGASASPAVTNPAAVRLRKSTSDSYPVPVRLVWAAYDSAYNGSFGINAQILPNLAAAIAKARTTPPTSTSALATIDLIGDSLTFSAPLNGGSYLRTNAWGRRMASHLTELGVPAYEDSINGAGIFTTTANVVAADARVAFGAGWAIQQQLTMGGNFFTAPNGVVTAMSFTPTAAFDTIEVEYLKNTSLGSFTVDIGGAALATTSSTGSLSLGRATISTGAGAATGTVNIKGNSTGDIYIFSIRTRNSAARKIEVCNYGIPTSTTNSWIGTSLGAYSALSRITFRAATATAICLGVNDWNTSVSLDTYTTNMQTLISQCKANGDVILIAPAQSNPAVYASAAVQQTYIDALKSLALTNGCGFFDLQYRLGSYPSASAKGMMDDDRHPSAIGADAWGFRLGQLISEI